MSYESVLTELKKLMRRELLDIDPDEYKAHVQGESDRASIILTAGVLEKFLVFQLNQNMPALNSDERSGIFQFEGPCGSFSSRIKMAQALGIVSRKHRRQLDMIREMRNVCAHAHPDVNFDTPEIRNAVYALCEAKHHPLLRAMPRPVLRLTFEALCRLLMQEITGSAKPGQRHEEIGAVLRFATENGLLPSPDKSQPQKSPGHPPMGGTDSQH